MQIKIRFCGLDIGMKYFIDFRCPILSSRLQRTFICASNYPENHIIDAKAFKSPEIDFILASIQEEISIPDADR